MNLTGFWKDSLTKQNPCIFSEKYIQSAKIDALRQLVYKFRTHNSVRKTNCESDILISVEKMTMGYLWKQNMWNFSMKC